MIITLTLQSAYIGNTSIGPFTVSGTTNGGSLNGVNMTTGSISTAQLTSGWGYNDTTDTITGGTINSSGTCITGKTWTVITATPTPTPTVTPTPEPLYQVDIRRGNAGDCSVVPSACSDYYSIGTNYTIYTASGGIGVSGEIAYADALGDSIFVGGPGPGYYYSDGVDGSRISNVGVITPYVSCNC